jgi:hypothetical protein
VLETARVDHLVGKLEDVPGRARDDLGLGPKGPT